MCGGSDKIYPERYTPIHVGKKLDCRDSCIIITMITVFGGCLFLPICGILIWPIVYYIKLASGDLKYPTTYPTLDPTISESLELTNTNFTNISY